MTGFVGSGTEPTPVEDQDMEKIRKRMGREDPKHRIDPAKGKLKVLVNMIGRETPVELDGLQKARLVTDSFKDL